MTVILTIVLLTVGGWIHTPMAHAEASLSGVVSYPEKALAAGVEVDIYPANPTSGQTFPTRQAVTNAQGQWSYAPLPAGNYQLVFIVVSSTGDRETEANSTVTLGEGGNQSIETTLSGPPGPGEAVFKGSVTAASGLPGGGATVTLTSSEGWTAPVLSVSADGLFSTTLPAGTYTVAISRSSSEADTSGAEFLTTSAQAMAGEVTTANYTLPAAPPLSVPTGMTASSTATDLGYLNAERAHWGLPAGLTANATWSQACAAHDAYMAANKVLEHPEQTGKPGHSLGGEWAGLHSILSRGSVWSSEGNPWEDAPIHLDQLYTPDIYTVGIDESQGYTCTTTWPGIGNPGSPNGTVITYPGNGTTGFPPAEDAAESPFVPGKFVGIPEGTIAGRELFVYEEQSPLAGPCAGFCFARAPSIETASLIGPSGPVQIKLVNGDNPEVGDFLTGAIIIPVQPLAPYATYTAVVITEPGASLFPGSPVSLPQVVHQWSFTTGAANPSGIWPSAADHLLSNSVLDAKRPVLARLHLTPPSFKAAHSGAIISRGHFGSTVAYIDTKAATTAFQVLRIVRGKVRGHLCVTPSRWLARARSCDQRIRVDLFSHQDKAGANRFHFSGHVGHHSLVVGAYELRVRASFSGLKSLIASTLFRIVK